jgi:predicted O-methyltransferase YrrM
MTEHPHAKNWSAWLAHLAGKPNVSGLEIGTFKGESAEWMCQNIFTHPTSQYNCVDPFTGSVDHKEAGIDCSNLEAEAREKLKPFPQCSIIKGYSQDVLKKMSADDWRMDFIYIDGSHTARDVLRDSVLAFDILKVGGTMIWDDYAWVQGKDWPDRPQAAIENFVLIYHRHFKVTQTGWQVCGIKKAE